MPTPYAFVTLVSSDSYLPGALALAAALKDVHPSPPAPPEHDFQTVCLVTPESVDVSTIKLLRRAFDLVVGVEILQQEDDRGLKLLGRPDLNTVLTKLHIFRLTQFSKIIFLDADVLPIRPLSHLFSIPHEFAAAPDVGWPDIFNSGVLVFNPGEDKFAQLNELLKSKGSWDGGDQGILNEWRGGDWHRLSFTYNTTPTAAYTYAPAYERYGSQISAIHFIGPNKPWKAIPYRAPFTTHQPSSSSTSTQQAYDYESLVDRWFSVYDKHYRAEAIVPPPSFEVRRYTSAWDDNAPATETISSKQPTGGNALGIDDLRRLAIEGINASAGGSDIRPGEGEYRSLPLEGRVDLMRPKKEKTEEEKQEEERQEEQGGGGGDATGAFRDADAYQSEDSPWSTPTERRISLPDESLQWRTLPTPGPTEVPPGPRPGFISLPPTPTPQTHYYQESSAGDTSDGEYHYGESPYYVPPPHESRHHSRHGTPRGSPPQHRGSPPQHRGSPPQQHGGHHGEEGQGLHLHHPQPHRHHHRQRPDDPSRHEHPADPQGQHHEQHQQRHEQQHHRHEHLHRQQEHQQHRYSPDDDRTPQQQHPPHQHQHHHRQQEHQQHRHSPDDDRTPQHQHPPHQHQHHHHEQHQHHEEPRRPVSPPMLIWNPAVEPPPNTTPTPSAFPSDTYFPNVWDQAPSRKADQVPQSQPQSQGPASQDSGGFFQAPPPSEIPQSLLREGAYRNVMGEEQHPGSPPAPDPSKVKTVFPWEEKPRHLPGRVFPAADAPKPSEFITPPPPAKPASPPPQAKPTSPMRLLSPLALPSSLGSTYSNAWDNVPSIQKYASKLVRPPQAAPPSLPAFDSAEWKKHRRRSFDGRSWSEKAEVSSRDGDDEDNADDEDEEEDDVPTHTNKWEDDDSDRGTSKRRSRSGSTASANYAMKGKKKEYRSQGVQTEKRVKHSTGVQATPDPPPPRPELMKRRSSTSSGRRHWPPSSGLGLLTPLTMHEAGIGHDMPVSMAAPSPMSEIPQGQAPRARSTKIPTPAVTPSTHSPLRSPREFTVSPVSAPVRPPKSSSPPIKPNNAVLKPSVPAVKSPTTAVKSPIPSVKSPVTSAKPTLAAAPRPSSTSPPKLTTSSPKSGSPPKPTIRTSYSSSSRPPSLVTRQVSNESLGSPPSSTGPVSPPDGQPLSPRIRRSGRVWDPARGVELFKRSSEEVLARFLKMGSWDENSR